MHFHNYITDTQFIKMMDKTLETGSSNIIPVVIKTDGQISDSKSSVATKEEFKMLRKYIIKTIKNISKEILSRKYKYKTILQ